MLTVQVLFGGETTSEILASVIKDEPRWNQLPEDTPHPIRRLLERCLHKDPLYRLRDIGEARIALEDVLSNPEPMAPRVESRGPAPTTSRLKVVLPWALLLLFVVAALIWRSLPDSPAPLTTNGTMRFEITLPLEQRLSIHELTDTTVALSPDGRTLVYTAEQQGAPRLFVRPVNRLESTPVPGTDAAHNPFFSPDGKWIAFTSVDRLKESLSGGRLPTGSGRGDLGRWKLGSQRSHRVYTQLRSRCVEGSRRRWKSGRTHETEPRGG